MEQSIFDETLPRRKLPYFIQERIYWRPMVHARNEMGWKALHEQLFPFDYGKKHCWDCGNELTKIRRLKENDLLETIFPIDYNFHGSNEFRCEKCKLRLKKTRAAEHHG